MDASLRSAEKRFSDLEALANKTAGDATARLAAAETAHEARLSGQITEFSQKAETSAKLMQTQHEAKLTEVSEKSNQALAVSDAEFNRLASNLNELEGRIKESIERATGYTLFHSFQKRQIDLAKSKRFWGIALACAVGVSLIVSGIFIYSLRFIQTYNAAFYLKLSISLPIIYAIAFCSVQYGRERRLEEEYAFKSTISISLDPYQKLVAQLVDRSKPEELAKYTAFVIDSVNRVFTSPTERIFDESSGEKNSPEKIIKAVGTVVEPFAKGLKH